MKELANKKISVIGAGVMGCGVAQRLIQYGQSVLLVDIEEEILNRAVHSIKRNLMLSNMMSEEKMDVDSQMTLLETTVELSDVKDSEFIIENITESAGLKEILYRKLDHICSVDSYFLVDTSCISITKIASYTKKPDRVIGVHFMNPVPRQRFAEVIKGIHTSAETILTVQEFLKNIKISCTVINDSVGFVSNRLSHIFMNEAANLVLEGVATPEQIDTIFTEGFHHEMGPLHTADLIGLDTVVDSLQVLFESYQDPKYKCSPLLVRMVDAGLKGRKSGKGFFQY